MAAIARDPTTYTIFNWPITSQDRAEVRLTYDGYEISLLRNGKTSLPMPINQGQSYRTRYFSDTHLFDRCVQKVTDNSIHLRVFRSNDPEITTTTVIGIDLYHKRAHVFKFDLSEPFFHGNQPTISFPHDSERRECGRVTWYAAQRLPGPIPDADVNRSQDCITIATEAANKALKNCTTTAINVTKKALPLLCRATITVLACKSAQLAWSEIPSLFNAVIVPAAMRTVEFLGYPTAMLTGVVTAVSIADACLPQYRMIEKIRAAAAATIDRIHPAEVPAG